MQGGKVQGLKVEVGDQVKNGQLLGWLSSRESLLKQRNTAQKAYELAQTQAELVLEKNPQFSQLEASLEEVQISFNTAQRAYEQAKKLWAIGAISREEYKKAEESFYLQEKELQAVQSQVNNLQLTSIKKTALLELAKAEAELAVIKENIQDVQLVAAIDGVVTQIFVENNEVALPGSNIIEIGQLKNKEIHADILADKVKDLEIGQQVEISGDMLKEEQLIRGKIIKIAPKAVLTHSLLGAEEFRVPVTISLDRQSRQLIPGGEVDLKIIKAKIEKTLVLDKDAVFEIQGEDHVFIVEKSKAQLRKIVLGLEGKNNVEVVEGLKEKDIAVIEPPEELKVGTRVKVEF